MVSYPGKIPGPATVTGDLTVTGSETVASNLTVNTGALNLTNGAAVNFGNPVTTGSDLYLSSANTLTTDQSLIVALNERVGTNLTVGATSTLGDNGMGEIQLHNVSAVPTTNPTAGVLVYADATSTLTQRKPAGTVAVLSGNLASVTSTTTVANTLTETVLGVATIPANEPKAGSVYHMYGYGQYSVTSTPTLTFKVYWGGLGGTNILSLPAINASNNITAAAYRYDVTVGFRSTTSLVASMHLHLVTDTGTSVAQGYTTTTAPTTVTTSAASDLAVSFKWSAASASNTISALGGNTQLVQ